MQFRLFFLFFFLINARYLLVTGNRIDDHPICVQNVIDTNKIAAAGTNIRYLLKSDISGPSLSNVQYGLDITFTFLEVVIEAPN